MNAHRLIICMLFITLVSISFAQGLAYELRTHGEIAGRAFDTSSGTGSYFIDVGIDPKETFNRQGRTTSDKLANFDNTGTLRDWMIEGAIREDDYTPHPLLERLGCEPPQNPSSDIDRPLHHFFDVQRGGRGLTIFPIISAIPAPDWALGRQGRGPNPTQNQFSILDARFYQLRSLTAPTRDERDKNLALLFRTLGQVGHILQDMAQPQHTRNDVHSGCLDAIGGEHSWYEDYLEKRARGQSFRTRGAPAPPLPLSSYTPPSFSTYYDFWTRADRKGLADFSSRNFFSAGTNLSLSGSCSGLPEPPCRPDAYTQRDMPFSIPTLSGTTISGNARLFLRTIQDPVTGAMLPDVAVASRSVWDQHLERRGLFPAFTLNTLNYDSISDVLLPRAVGYAAGLLDYFFRGKLNVDLTEDPQDPSVLQLTGINASDETLVDGALTLYADDPSGRRTEAGALDPIRVAGTEKGQPLPPIRFQAPEDAERFVAVYQGTLGQETKDDSGTNPGAVIGKVLGGVRVEEVFSDGEHWHLRTPQGVFSLPISGQEIEELRWGDRDNTLIGRTPFGPEEPNQVVAYEIARPAGSTDIPLRARPDGGREVDVTVTKQVAFPFGLDLGTTIDFSGTIQYTQYTLSYVRTTTYRADCPQAFCPYRITDQTVSDGKASILVNESRTLSRNYPLRLDRGSLSCCDFVYEWRLDQIWLTAAGQILASIAVDLISPWEKATFPAFALAVPEGGQRYIDGNVALQPVAVNPVTVYFSFPLDMGPALWALVDVGAGHVVASTAPATLTINHVMPYIHTTPALYCCPGDAIAREFRKERFLGGQLDGVYRYTIEAWVDTPPSRSCTDADLAGAPALGELTFVNGTLAATISRYRPEIAQLQFPSPVEDILTITRQPQFLCTSQNLISASFKVTTTSRDVRQSRLEQVRRAEPGADTERLILLMAQSQGGMSYLDRFLYRAKLATWTPAHAGTELRQEFPLPGFHIVSSVSSRTALVTSETFDKVRLMSVTLGTSLVPLQGEVSSTFFANALLDTFVLLDPEFLYNTDDLKFYRTQPPLQRTALPARLAPVASESYPAAYHVLRLK